MGIRKITLYIFAFFGGFFPFFAHAICPVCTVAVGFGIGLSRWLGIDDTISGIWVGALAVSISAWSINVLRKRNIKFFGMPFVTYVVWYAMIIIPLWYYDIIGHPLNSIWGIDKLIIGIIAGTIVFALAVFLYEYLKKKNNGRAHFPFQKVVIPIVVLGITSGIFYFITR